MAKKNKAKRTRQDPRRRWVTTLAGDILPGPGGQPGHKAGTEVLVVQVVSHPDLGRVAFAAPRPSALLFAAGQHHVKRASRLQKAILIQTTDKGFIKPHTDRRFTNDSAVLDFFEEAMAAIILLHAALDSFANECMPEGFEMDVKGEVLTREQLEQRGIELRLSRAASEALTKPNLMDHNPELWASVAELKGLRDDCYHVKSQHAYSSDPAADTIFARLLVADLSGLQTAAELVFEHYGDAPREMPDQDTGTE